MKDELLEKTIERIEALPEGKKLFLNPRPHKEARAESLEAQLAQKPKF